MDKSFFYISSLLDIYNIFTCSIITIRAIDYPSPRVPTRHFRIVCKICDRIKKAKAFVGTRGERYAIKRFLIKSLLQSERKIDSIIIKY